MLTGAVDRDVELGGEVVAVGVMGGRHKSPLVIVKMMESPFDVNQPTCMIAGRQ